MLAVVVAAYVAMGSYFWATQDQKIFAPLEAILRTPADLKPPLDFEDVEIPCEQSALHGYWIAAHDDNAPTVLYLHGQDATIGKNLEHAQCLHELGCSVLVIDYRGFGKTYGTMTPSETSVYQDAEAAWRYLTETRGVEANRILIYGHSLGGAIAIELATRHSDAGGLVSENTFTTTRHIAQWKFPVTCTLPLDYLLLHHFDSLEKLRTKDLPPVLFVHGTGDTKVPHSMCNELFEATQSAKKDMLLIDGGQHASHGHGEELYRATMTRFLDRCFQRSLPR